MTSLCVGAVRNVVYMLAVANINGSGGCAAKRMVVTIGKVCAELDLVNMTAAGCYRLAGNGGNAVAVAVITGRLASGATQDFVYVLLFVAVVAVGCVFLIHEKPPFCIPGAVAGKPLRLCCCG